MNDKINGFFELVGGLLMIINCRRMYIDKQLKGSSVWPVIFFTSWGYWNMYYYPMLQQWYSLVGGIVIAITNSIWIVMVFYYKYYYKEKKCSMLDQ